MKALILEKAHTQQLETRNKKNIGVRCARRVPTTSSSAAKKERHGGTGKLRVTSRKYKRFENENAAVFLLNEGERKTCSGCLIRSPFA